MDQRLNRSLQCAKEKIVTDVEIKWDKGIKEAYKKIAIELTVDVIIEGLLD